MARLTSVLLLASVILLGAAPFVPAAQADGVSLACAGGTGATVTLGGQAHPVCVLRSACGYDTTVAAIGYGAGTFAVCAGNNGCPFVDVRTDDQVDGPSVLPASACGPFACDSTVGAGAGLGDIEDACAGASLCGAGVRPVIESSRDLGIQISNQLTTDCYNEQYAEDMALWAAQTGLRIVSNEAGQVEGLVGPYVDSVVSLIFTYIPGQVCYPAPANGYGLGVSGGVLGVDCYGVWVTVDQGCSDGTVHEGVTVAVAGVYTSTGNPFSVCA